MYLKMINPNKNTLELFLLISVLLNNYKIANSFSIYFDLKNNNNPTTTTSTSSKLSSLALLSSSSLSSPLLFKTNTNTNNPHSDYSQSNIILSSKITNKTEQNKLKYFYTKFIGFFIKTKKSTNNDYDDDYYDAYDYSFNDLEKQDSNNFILRTKRDVSIFNLTEPADINFINNIDNTTLMFETDWFLNKNRLTKSFVFIHYQKILIGFFLYSLTIWTIIGNIFVCIAIMTNKQLKQGGMSNFLIGNLALSDLLLGLTVLPFSATLTTFKSWLFGGLLCDIWLSIDVLCSSASIWGLLVIALDRYIATNHPIRYRKQKNSIKIAILYCTISWAISIFISLGPLIVSSEDPSKGTKKSGLRQVENSTDYECVLFQTPSFVIVSSLFSFYLPLVLMFILYTGVFLRIRQQSKLFQNKPSKESKTQSLNNLSETQEIFPKETKLDESNNSTNKQDHKLEKKKSLLRRPVSNQSHNSEAKITKTLAIIMGVFVACWLPFFTIYIIRSQLNEPDSIPGGFLDIFIWLGYFNSALNPILYAILNHNFRIAFTDILACRCFGRNRAYNSSIRLNGNERVVKRNHVKLNNK